MAQEVGVKPHVILFLKKYSLRVSDMIDLVTGIQ